MKIYKKPQKYLLHFVAYFLLVVLLPFDHCHAAIDKNENSQCRNSCNATSLDLAKNDYLSGLYEREYHTHHRHHIRFLIDSEDAALKSSPSGESAPAFFSYALMTIIEPLYIPGSKAVQVVLYSPANPLRYHLFKFSGLPPPCV